LKSNRDEEQETGKKTSKKQIKNKRENIDREE
jgi:hypothetical protein